MNPWHIIGWIILVIPAVLIALTVAVYVISNFASWKRYMASRKTKPEAGQIWVQQGDALHITRITDNGRICIQVGCASWSDSPEEWQRRVRGRRLYLRNAP